MPTYKGHFVLSNKTLRYKAEVFSRPLETPGDSQHNFQIDAPDDYHAAKLLRAHIDTFTVGDVRPIIGLTAAMLMREGDPLPTGTKEAQVNVDYWVKRAGMKTK